MANKYTNLSSLFSAIADAIRTKTGDTAQIKADDFPNAITSIPSNEDAIVEGGTLTSYTNDRITKIGTYKFRTDTKLKSLSCANCKIVASSAFADCSTLTDVNLPKVTNIFHSAFEGCGYLKNVYIPNGVLLYSFCFAYTNLHTVDFLGEDLLSNGSYKSGFISESVFKASGLRTLIIRGTHIVCELYDINAFDSTPIADGTGYIYVPSALIEEYKVADNWSTYANQFRALEDYTVDGTTTGELDESKI